MLCLCLAKELLLEWSLEWSFCLWCDSGKVATLPILPVNQSRVACYSVIPDNHSLLCPLYASLEIGTKADVVVKELEKIVRFLLLIADNVASNWHTLVLSPGDTRVQLLHCGFTKSAFSPVTGWVRTRGWVLMSGSRRTILPLDLDASTCSTPE